MNSRTEPGVVIDAGIRVEHASDGVRVLTFDAPPVNALDRHAYRAAARHLREVVSPDVRAVVITGAGAQAFCAGTDRHEFTRNGAELEESLAAAAEFFTALASVPCPLLAGVNGPAIGGGAMIASECDVVVMATGTWFAVPELQLGVPGGGAHVFRLAPRYVALRMMLLGERFTAAQALEHGVAAAVVDGADLVSTCLRLAQTIAGLDAGAVAAARTVVRAMDQDNSQRGYLAEMDALRHMRAHKEPGDPLQP